MTTHLYDTDFRTWTLEQFGLLQSQQFEQLDLVNLIEEIESLGRKKRQELRNRLGVLLGHLLKCQFQPEQRTNSWVGAIQEILLGEAVFSEDSSYELAQSLDSEFLPEAIAEK